VAGTGSTGSVVWRESEQPFGEDWITAPANDNQAGYTGHVEDAATGLVYMQARYYDPVIGRFLANDPVGFSPARPDMFNRYAYAANDPVNSWDPDGKQVIGPGHNGGPPLDDPIKPVENKSGPLSVAGRALPLAAVGFLLGGERRVDVVNANSLVARYNNTVNDQLDFDTLTAAKRELGGETVTTKGNGVPYDHVTKVREAQQSLRKIIRDAQNQLGHRGTSEATKEKLQEVISSSSKKLDYSEKYEPKDPPPNGTTIRQ
jgi:RHS repeat-associated protein